MPGPAIHISVMRHAAQSMADAGYAPERGERVDPSWAGPDPAELGRVMREHDNFAALGAHGPDLFFLLPDFREMAGIPVSSVLTFVLDFLESVYDAVDPYISKWEHYLGPISEDTAEEISRLLEYLQQQSGRRYRSLAESVGLVRPIWPPTGQPLDWPIVPSITAETGIVLDLVS
jgi:hypothetical protein